MLLVCAVNIWFGSIETFWDIWKFGKFVNVSSMILWAQNVLILCDQNLSKPLDQNLLILFASSVYIKKISKHFGPVHYAWRHDIV